MNTIKKVTGISNSRLVDLTLELEEIESQIKAKSRMLTRWKEMDKFQDRQERKAKEIEVMKTRANEIMDILEI